MGSSSRFGVCPQPWGQGLVLTVCPSAAVLCPPLLVLSILTILLWPSRTDVPLPGALSHIVACEAAALGSGPPELAVGP